MKVTLLQATPVNVANIASSCSVGRVNNPSETSLENAVKYGHLSVLEHIYFTFKIEDISRACSHQLVRHRIASYTQKSQRYTKLESNKEDWFHIPFEIEENNELKVKYCLHMHVAASIYNSLIENGIKPEDARYILPNACFTDIVMSMNARAFIEQCTKRLCIKAQTEIHNLFDLMIQTIRMYSRDYDFILKLCIPPCNNCKEKNPCKLVKE